MRPTGTARAISPRLCEGRVPFPMKHTKQPCVSMCDGGAECALASTMYRYLYRYYRYYCRHAPAPNLTKQFCMEYHSKRKNTTGFGYWKHKSRQTDFTLPGGKSYFHREYNGREEYSRTWQRHTDSHVTSIPPNKTPIPVWQ